MPNELGFANKRRPDPVETWPRPTCTAHHAPTFRRFGRCALSLEPHPHASNPLVMGYLEDLEDALERTKNWRPSESEAELAKKWVDYFDEVRPRLLWPFKTFLTNPTPSRPFPTSLSIASCFVEAFAA